MSLSKDKLTEMIGMFRAVWDEKQSLKASQEITREILKEKKAEIKAWAEANELAPSAVFASQDQYEKAQAGKFEIGADASGHMSYEDLVFQVFEFLRTSDD